MNFIKSANKPKAARKGHMILLTFSLIAAFSSLLLPRISSGESVLFEGDSIYNHITVREDDSERCMIFGRHADNRETCIDLKEPDQSVFEYTAMMFVGFLFRAETRNVCLIGLGGGYIPTVFRMHLPYVKLHTIEIDPLVQQLAVKYFKFAVPGNQRLTIADGRQYLRRKDRKST